MNSEEIKKSHQGLLKIGFTPTQAEQLSKFRGSYIEREKQQGATELHHLEFMRWLVTTGRLMD
jgi:hypothetical protein